MYVGFSKEALRCRIERLGTIPLNKLTTAHIVKEKDILFQQGKKSSTVRRYMVILNHMLNVATLQWELLQKNPCSAVKKPQDSKDRTRFLSQKEIKVVLEKCKASTHYQLYPIGSIR